MKLGDRVGAIYFMDVKTIYLFGYGTYERDAVAGPEAAGILAEKARTSGIPGPIVRLDDGQTVYACECWMIWSEDLVRRLANGHGVSIAPVDIGEHRRRSQK